MDLQMELGWAESTRRRQDERTLVFVNICRRDSCKDHERLDETNGVDTNIYRLSPHLLRHMQ